MRSVFTALCLLSLVGVAHAGVIEGRCVDQDGERYPGLEVTLERLHWGTISEIATAEAIATTLADASAEFRFENVDEGEYRLICYANDQHPTGWFVLALPDQGPYEVGVTNRYRLARGRVLDQEGNPVEGAIIWRSLVQPIPNLGRVRTVMASAETDASGEFTLEPVIERGRCPVGVELPDGERFSWVLDAENREDLTDEFTVLTEPVPVVGHPVMVRVVDNEQSGVTGAEVHLSRAQEGIRGASPSPVTTNESGDAVFSSVPPGRWQIRVTDGGNHDTMHEVVSPQTGPPVVVQLYGEGVIRGSVLNSRGAPVAGMGLWAQHCYLDPGTGRETYESRNWTRSGPDGTFAFEGLIWGEYSLSPSITDSLVRQPDVFANERFTLSPDTPEITLTDLFTIDNAGERCIHGQVRDVHGRPVEGARVVLVMQENSIRITGGRATDGGIIEHLDMNAGDVTDTNGRFSLLLDVRPDRVAGIYAEDDGGNIGLITLQHRQLLGDIADREFQLTIAEPVTVEGVAMREGRPATHFDIIAHAQTPIPPVDGRFQHYPLNSDYTAMYTATPAYDGRFSIGPLPRGTRWQFCTAFGPGLGDTDTLVEIPLWGDVHLDPVIVEDTAPRSIHVTVQAVEQSTRKPVGNVLITGDLHANFDQRTGPNGEAITMYVSPSSRAAEGTTRMIVDVEGYRTIRLEGLPHEPWQEEPRPNLGRPPLTGWIIQLEPNRENEITILMERE